MNKKLKKKWDPVHHAVNIPVCDVNDDQQATEISTNGLDNDKHKPADPTKQKSRTKPINKAYEQ